MARRRSLLTSLLKTAESVGASARRAAREREKSLRRQRALAERETRTLARLAKAEEREMAMAAAAEEHAENEELLASIRNLLKRAPTTIRGPKDHERWLAPATFPPPDRIEADRARLDRDLNARLASIRIGKPIGLLALAGVGVMAALAGVVLCFTLLWVGIASLAVGSVAAVGLAWKASLKEQAALAVAGTRAREDVVAAIARDLERDQTAHDATERARIERLQKLLAGDGQVSAEVFQAAVDALELPLDASAVAGMASTDTAEIEVNLHAPEEIPVQQSTLLKSGRITYRNRPKREVQEDDARALASLASLYAAMAFDVLPAVETVILSAFRAGIDAATGDDAEHCYASVIFERETFLELKLERLDPVIALRSHDARIACSATHILKPVEPFELGQCASSEPAAAAPAPLDLARHASVLAMACARADGAFEPAEAEAIASLLAERFPVSTAQARRLQLWRASLVDHPLSIEGSARALRAALAPRDRQLLLERLFQVVAAGGKLREPEIALLERVARELDTAPTLIEELQRRHAPVNAAGNGAEDTRSQRWRWLAALDLPRDAGIDHLTVERARRRLEDIYAEEKFALVAPELRDMARARLMEAREAAAQLLSELPAPAAPHVESSPTAVRRDNSDLDSIFAA